MTRRLARLALTLYPLAFRRRYGEEMCALLDQSPPRVLSVLDLLRGALIAHLRPVPSLGGLVGPADRVRASASGVLACWVVFVAAGLGYFKTTEDPPFAAAGHAHQLLGAAHSAVQLLAVVGSAGVLVGALPLIIAAVARAQREPRLRFLVTIPGLAVTLFAGLTVLLSGAARSHTFQHATTPAYGALFVWMLAALACGAVCVVVSRQVLFAVPLARGRLVVAFACAALVTAAMAAMALATALYTVGLALDASQLASTPNGPLQLMGTSVSLIVQFIVMAAAATLAATTTRRGWRAATRLTNDAQPT